MKKVLFLVLLAFSFIFSATSKAQTTIYIHSGGNITFSCEADKVDSVAIYRNKLLRLFDADKNGLYAIQISKIDSITFADAHFVADLLDVEFRADGTARDNSLMKNTITLKGNGVSTYFSKTYQRYVARFHQIPGTQSHSYYKVDYASNDAFKKALADGHTLEVVFMADYNTAAPTSNGIKFFSSHDSGGTGFSLGTGSHQLYFTHNVSTTGSSNYISIGSKVVPQTKVYYHAVAVWNKEEQRSYIYVDGVLKNSANAPGEFLFSQNSGAQWFGIGCDAKDDNLWGESSFHGDVVLARIYDRAMTKTDVQILWQNLQNKINKEASDLVTDINYWSGMPVKIGYDFDFAAKGVQTGDQLQLVATGTSGKSFIADLSPVGTDSARFVIPENFTTGKYRMTLTRGEDEQDLGLIKFNVVTKMPAAPLIYAHRGYWDIAGSAENSITSYKKACEQDIYAMELDVWLTTDDSIIVNHDATLNDVTIQTSSYEQVKNLQLSNGEYVPRLQDFLKLVQDGGKVKLLIEFKAHSTLARSYECVQKVMDAVNSAGILDRCEFHSQNNNICAQITKIEPRAFSAPAAYSGFTPQKVKDMGCSSYNTARAFVLHPEWVAQTYALGMKIVPFTPDQPDLFLELINNGVEALGTNNIKDALRLRAYLLSHQKD